MLAKDAYAHYKDAYAHYKEACDASGEKPKSARAFHKRLRDMDFETGVSYGKDYYRNVRYLKDSDIEAAAKAKESATPF